MPFSVNYMSKHLLFHDIVSVRKADEPWTIDYVSHFDLSLDAPSDDLLIRDPRNIVL